MPLTPVREPCFLEVFSDSHRQQRTHEVVDIARHGAKNRDAITSGICIQLISKIICNLRSIKWKIRDPTLTDDMIHRVAKPTIWCGGWLVSAKLPEADNVTPKAEIVTFS